MGKSKPLITICIPTYNREDYLAKTLESVFKQTYSNFEVILINDASVDGTEKFIQKVKDLRVKYYKNKVNIGYIPSMQRGLKLAKGRWIVFLSDDDLMEPTMLEEMVSVIPKDSSKLGFIVPQSMNIDSQGKIISIPKKQLANKEWILLEPKEFIFNFTLYGRKIRNKYIFNTSFPSTLFNKKILMEMGGSSVELPISHDILIGSKISLLYNVLVIDKPLLRYRAHENLGSSLNKSGEFIKEYANFLKILFQFVEDKSIKFNYDFKTYCDKSLTKYLFKFDGGLIRFATRFSGNETIKIKIILSYLKFGLFKNKYLILYPNFYVVLFASFLPKNFLVFFAKMFHRI